MKETLRDLWLGYSQHVYHKSSQHQMRSNGSYKRRLKRPSRALAADRPYMAGDPVGLIDWKAFAKNEQLIIRQEEDRTPGTIKIIIDSSSSMAWPDSTIKDGANHPNDSPVPITKGELAWRITVAIIESYLRDGNIIELYNADLQTLLNSSAEETMRVRSSGDKLAKPAQLIDAVMQNGRRLRVRNDLSRLAEELLADPGFKTGNYTLQQINFTPVAGQRTYYIGDAIFLSASRKPLGGSSDSPNAAEGRQSKQVIQDAMGHSFLTSVDTLIHVLSTLERNPQWMNPKWGYSVEPQSHIHIHRKSAPEKDGSFRRLRTATNSFRGRFLKGRGDLQAQVATWCLELEATLGKFGSHYVGVSEDNEIEPFFADLFDTPEEQFRSY